MVNDRESGRKRTQKYERKREKILHAAAKIMNLTGLKGMTRAKISEQFGGVQSSIAYYFPTQESLAAECFMHSIDWHNKLIEDSASKKTKELQIRHLINKYFKYCCDVEKGDAVEMAVFDDVRSLGDEQVIAAYVDMFRNLRSLISNLAPSNYDRSLLNGRTHWLMQQLIWVRLWLPSYSIYDYQRAAELFGDIILHGIKKDTSSNNIYNVNLLKIALKSENNKKVDFVKSAIKLINEYGYRGTSIEEISAERKVTKGAFYHHIEDKEELIDTCFTYSTNLVSNVYRSATSQQGDALTKLASLVIFLVSAQLSGEMPVLRAAIASVPDSIRIKTIREYNKNTLSFASLVSDGIADGSIRIVDANIAAQIVSATLNGGAELGYWLPKPYKEPAAIDFVNSLLRGILN